MVDDTGSYPTEIVGQFHNVNFLELFLLHPFDKHIVLCRELERVRVEAESVATKFFLHRSEVLPKHVFPCLASISPKNPAYASKQWSKKSSGIYISSNDSEHNQYQKRCHRNMYRVTYRKDSCMKGFGKC